MKRGIYYSVITIAVVVCAALLLFNLRASKRHKEPIVHSRDRLRAVEKQNAATDNSRGGPLKEKNLPAQQDAAHEPAKSPTDKAAVKYDVEAIKKMTSSIGSNLEDILRHIITNEGLKAVLQDHEAEPAYWVAAASLLQDKKAKSELLEHAAGLYTNSPIALSALLDERIANGLIDETSRAWIAQLKLVDQANALPCIYDADFRFRAGDIDGALRSLAAAAAQDRFSDRSIEKLMSRYDFLLREGCSETVAMGLSAFTLPFPQLSMLREMSRCAQDQVHALSMAGRYEEALQVARNLAGIGKTVSSSGRFIIHDRVGIALNRAGLSAQKELYNAMGENRYDEEIAAQLRALETRDSLIDAKIEAFNKIFQRMNAEEIGAYVDQTILHGEFSVLQDIPEE